MTARAVLFLFDVIETNILRASPALKFSHGLGHDRTFARFCHLVGGLRHGTGRLDVGGFQLLAVIFMQRGVAAANQPRGLPARYAEGGYRLNPLAIQVARRILRSASSFIGFVNSRRLESGEICITYGSCRYAVPDPYSRTYNR